jgi:methionyl-tRNA synthetase
LRFYLARITPYSQVDLNFDLNEFKSKINNELVANIGNFAYRSLILVKREYDLTIPDPREKGPDEVTLRTAQQRAVSESAHLIEAGNYDRALKSVLDFGNSCNQYFQQKAPWEKRPDMNTAIYYSANCVASLAVLLEPFIPHSSSELWRQLKFSDDLSSVEWDAAGSLLLDPAHKISEPKPIFRKVEDEDLMKIEKIIHASK